MRSIEYPSVPAKLNGGVKPLMAAEEASVNCPGESKSRERLIGREAKGLARPLSSPCVVHALDECPEAAEGLVWPL